MPSSISARRVSFSFVSAAALLALGSGAALGQVGYGVTGRGQLFNFPLDMPNNPVNNIGPLLGFVPEGIDFRPGSNTLYAIDVGPNTTQLYSIDINTGLPTAIGTGFASSGLGYDLTGNQTFGFDVNPTTLDANDQSIRIRLVGSNGSNLRIHTGTGQIAAVDAGLAIAPSGGVARVDAVAYTNSNKATSGGTTQLFDLDFQADDLFLQNPPDSGALNLVGPMGVTIDAIQDISFDILTDPSDIDPTIGGDQGWAVLRRPDAPINGPLGAYLLYKVNLATGQITNGALVGSTGDTPTPADFIGGFAVIVPGPGAAGLMALAGLVAMRRRRA